MNTIWTKVSERTRRPPTVCKAVIFSLLYGYQVISVMQKFNLETLDVVDIRMAFDDLVMEKKE